MEFVYLAKFLQYEMVQNFLLCNILKDTIHWLQISHIGLPMNVTHTGHARSAEEAQKLIESLMTGGVVTDGACNGDVQQPRPPSRGNIQCNIKWAHIQSVFSNFPHAR